MSVPIRRPDFAALYPTQEDFRQAMAQFASVAGGTAPAGASGPGPAAPPSPANLQPGTSHRRTFVTATCLAAPMPEPTNR